MINSTKMKKIAKAECCAWGVEEIDGKTYMLVTDNYRIYKDNIHDFDPKVKSALFERFGFIPESGKTYRKDKGDNEPHEIRGLNSLLLNKEYFEHTYFMHMIYRTETSRCEMGEAYVFKATKGLVFINREYLDVFKNIDMARVETSNGEINGMNKFTFIDEDMEYVVLPLRFGDKVESSFLRIIEEVYDVDLKKDGK